MLIIFTHLDELSVEFSCNFTRVVLQLFFLVCAMALMLHFPFKIIKFRFIPTGKYNRKAILPWLWLNQTILGNYKLYYKLV